QAQSGISIGIDAGGVGRGELPVVHRLFEIVRRVRVTEVLGQLRGMLVEPTRVLRFERVSDLLVHSHASGGADIVVECLAEQRVGEAVAPLADSRLLLQHAEPRALLESRNYRLLWQTRNLPEDIQPKATSDYRGDC